MPIESEVTTVVAPILNAVWIHDPDDPEGTIMHYLYHSQRSESMSVEVEPSTYAGRRYPVFNFGEHSLRALKLPMQIPFADEDWEAKTEYLTALLEARKAFIYRDMRSRLIYGVTDGLDWNDIAIGSTVELTIQAAEFDEEIA